MRFKISNSFTLIETVVAIGILALLAAIVMSGLSSFQQSGELARAADLVAGTLRDARGRTLASKYDTVYGAHFDLDRVVLFEGAIYTAGAASNETTMLPLRVEIAAITLGGANHTTFRRLSGEATATGTITVRVKQESSKTKEIKIYDSGVIEIK